MSLSHQDARVAVSNAFKRLVPTFYPTQAAMQWAQGVAVLESNYGSGKATNNWGNVQCNHQAPARDGECVILEDSYVDGTPFKYPYRVYASPEDGAFGMLDLIHRKWPKALEAADRGDTLGASRALYGYYTGKKPKGSKLSGKALTDYLIRVHAEGVYQRASEVAKALDEKLLLNQPTKPGKTGDSSAILPIMAVMGAVALLGKGKS